MNSEDPREMKVQEEEEEDKRKKKWEKEHVERKKREGCVKRFTLWVMIYNESHLALFTLSWRSCSQPGQQAISQCPLPYEKEEESGRIFVS